MKFMSTAIKKKIFIHSARLEQLPYPAECPFDTDRAGQVRKILASKDMLAGADRVEIEPEPATRKELEIFHSADYLDVLELANDGRFNVGWLTMGLGTGDCPVFEGVNEYGVLSTGATLTGAKEILSGDAQIAFNPSGGLHHAMAGRASGFCYINDVALGCLYLANNGRKVLYLDVDVHHGDGVQAACYDRDDVMTVSLHQTGQTLFPGTGFEDEIGKNAGRGYSVNVPLPPGTYDEIYINAFKNVVLPLIESYKPDVFVCQLGADGLLGDPLASFCLTNNAYVEVISELLKFDRPILATGGGGYNIENTVRAWSRAWATLCGDAKADELKDKEINLPKDVCERVASNVDSVVESVKKKLFGLHGL